MRINLKQTQYEQLRQTKILKNCRTFNDVVKHIIDNQRPPDHQAELDEEVEKTTNFKKEAERISWKYNKVMSDLWTIFTQMRDNDQMITINEMTMSELAPELKSILEQTVYLPPIAKAEDYDYFSRTVKVPDIVNEELE